MMVDENSGLYMDQMMSVELLINSFSVFAISAVDQFPDYLIFAEDLMRSFSEDAECLKETISSKSELYFSAATDEQLETFYSRAM